MEELQEQYKKALRFAARRHEGQKVRGTELPYLVHVINVAMEVLIASFHTPGFDARFAVTVALLHDTVEDTKTSYQEVAELFGNEVADAVLSLTKFDNLEKDLQITDSLHRIKQQRNEIWAVKLADRITNLEAPPVDWDYRKRKKYHDDACEILETLKGSNIYLEKRLQQKIIDYQSFVINGDK